MIFNTVLSFYPPPSFSTTPKTPFTGMRPSSRLLVPALTILCWSLESAYASFRPPGQGLYKRQFRTADYSTRPLHNPSNGTKSPETDTSSPPHSGSDVPPQTSAKTRRSPHDIKSQLPGSSHLREKRQSSNEASTYAEYNESRPSHGFGPSTGNKSHSMHVRDAFNKRTTSFTAQRKSDTNNDMTTHSLDPVRRSVPVDINTLHIARAMQKFQPPIQAVDPSPPLSHSRKATSGVSSVSGQGESRDLPVAARVNVPDHNKAVSPGLRG
ncbi:hypothetical protein C0995_010398 [Termitomyces sp. Mi166|nr:hypothetical protein C0995_010398 [Termitomyces sp. Mi166\